VLAWWRTFTVSAERFRTLALLSLGGLFVVMATGAVVRLTGSGLGCENWPRCGDTPFPASGIHSYVEFGNRVVALIAILVNIAVAIAARRVDGLPRRTGRLAVAVAACTVAQIPLGGLTVMLDLNPYVVMSHFLLALLTIGLAVLVALDAHAFARGPSRSSFPRALGLLSLVLLPAALVLIVTGAFVTAAGPHPGSSGDDIPRLGNVVDAAHVHAVATAVFGSVLAVCVLALLWRRREARAELKLAIGVIALLGVEIGVGQWQWNTGLPWGVVLLHVVLATMVWAGLVALVARLLAASSARRPSFAGRVGGDRARPVAVPSPRRVTN
jgi:cytochrome c oxidase assembly protein subunit 15